VSVSPHLVASIRHTVRTHISISYPPKKAKKPTHPPHTRQCRSSTSRSSCRCTASTSAAAGYSQRRRLRFFVTPASPPSGGRVAVLSSRVQVHVLPPPLWTRLITRARSSWTGRRRWRRQPRWWRRRRPTRFHSRRTARSTTGSSQRRPRSSRAPAASA
jgi:hypothetical protein